MRRPEDSLSARGYHSASSASPPQSYDEVSAHVFVSRGKLRYVLLLNLVRDVHHVETKVTSSN